MSKYCLGLDVGTNSVGWALVDENNQIVRKNGFSLWGVRMFEESKDASSTRSFRTSRRRLERRKYRIELLREIFNDEINNIDPTFFERLDDSFYKLEDKKNQNIYNLFNDKYTDKMYYDEFPTIFHLRNHLMKIDEKADIRFLYLAMHHMIKYRGNFLYQGDSFNKSDNGRIIEIFEEINVLLIEMGNEFEDYSDYFQTVSLNKKDYEKLEEILISNSKKNEKRYLLKQLFEVENKTFVNEFIIPLLVGAKCNVSGLYPVKALKYEKAEIDLNLETLEEDIENAKTKVNELADTFNCALSLKEVCDYYFLIKLLQNSKTISEAMINQYDNHKDDLEKLKNFFKLYLPKKYNECFREYNEKINSYSKYIGMTSSESKPIKRFKHCSRKEFYAYLQSLFNTVQDENGKIDMEYFKSKMENDEFLLRQNSEKNGSLPMQLNLDEMKTILDIQSKYYSFLNEKDDTGYTNKEKIISIFKFIIPYYVGPLATRSKRSWLTRTNEKIYPWNFDKVVNLDESATKFIQKMQRKCTYLKGKDDYCLPKNSIIFSKYNCLSYLNKLSINGTLISKKLKNEIFENVFLKIKKPTKKNIYDYIKSNYGDVELSTSKLKDLPEVNCNMASYIVLKEILKDNFNIELAERIIKDIVIFSDKKILEKRLLEVYKLDIQIVKRIKDLNYKGYSNLSNKLLSGISIKDPITGEIYGNVLDIMVNTNCNLQEILYNPQYRLIDIIDDYNKNILSNVDEMGIDEFLDENVVVNPTMKRAMVQTYNIIKEIRKIINGPIKKYYIECARSNKQEKKQTKSRYDYIKDLYNESKKIINELHVDFKKLESDLDKNKDNLKSDLLYLYFTQLGKCMYTLKDINLHDLLTSNNKYDIDHIYPQAIVKDDSLSNRVLVCKEANETKSDNFLFEIKLVPENAHAFYEKLKDAKLISKEKFRRLTKTELAPNELETFVNRQLVSTNQAVKGLIQILKLYDKVDQSDIVYSKAENISDARKLFDLPKSRSANNFHHAHDAYLNVVFGRVINEYYIKNHFNGSIDYYRMKNEGKTINTINILRKDRIINGKKIWDISKTIPVIEKNLYERYDVSETLRTNSPNDLFSKVTILPAGKGDSVPMKSSGPRSNVEKYGGITSYSYFKYIIVKTSDKKGNEIYKLEAIPKVFEKREDEYLLQNGYVNYKIMHNNIKANVVVKNGSLKYYITGKSDNSFHIKNSNDRFFTKNFINIIKKIDKYNMNLAFEVPMVIKDDSIIISPAKNKKCEAVILYKKELQDLLIELKNKFSKKQYSFSVILTIVKQLEQLDINKLNITNLLKLNIELIGLLQTNARNTADLTLIGMASKTGTLRASKTLTPGTIFISESVTGYYSKVLFEVPNNGI